MAYFDSGAGALGYDLPDYSTDDLPSMEEVGEMAQEEAESRAREYGEEVQAEAEAEVQGYLEEQGVPAEYAGRATQGGSSAAGGQVSQATGGGGPAPSRGSRSGGREVITILPLTEAEQRARRAPARTDSSRAQLARQRGAALMASHVMSGAGLRRGAPAFTSKHYRAGKAVEPLLKASLAQARAEASKKRGMSKGLKAGALVGVALLAYAVLK